MAVLILAGIQFVIVVDETTVALLAPAVAREFGLGDIARQILITPFAVGFVAGLPTTALLLRRIDPRRVLPAATAAFAVTAGLGALAPSAPLLVGARVLQGLAAAMVATSALASLHVITRSDPRRLRAFAAYSMVSGSGAVVALVAFAPLAQVSWRWCFVTIALAALGLSVAWAPLGYRTGGAPEPTESPGVGQSRDADARAETVRTATMLAAVVGANAALSAVVITVSFVLQQDCGWTTTLTGLGFLPLNAAAAVALVAVSPLAARWGVGAVLAGGLLVIVVGCGLLAASPPTPLYLLGSTVVVGAGIGIVFPLVNSGSLASAQEQPLGRAAWLGAAQQLGVAAGALVAAAHSGGPIGALAAVLGAAVVAGLVVLGRCGGVAAL
ncbi:MFS transporter [Gordonia sp. DT30]|uniref:MFS transporter n=1 Tax=Gordonia sp. DT30 TaxID=3416546 RepID=UPI003CF162A0